MQEAVAEKSRVDEHGRAWKGSQLQVQIYVNRRRDELNEAVLQALPSLAIRQPRLRWVSPLEDRLPGEYYDSGFLEALRYGELGPLLRSFWPASGPRWDALATIEGLSGNHGVLLVEGKSYPAEFRGTGMTATSKESHHKIERALEATQNWLAVPDAHRDSWTGPLYQNANRFAHLYWFRNVAGVETWLLHVLFLNDEHHPTSERDWEIELVKIDEELGIDRIPVPHAAHVLLPARPREELVLSLAEAAQKYGSSCS